MPRVPLAGVPEREVLENLVVEGKMIGSISDKTNHTYNTAIGWTSKSNKVHDVKVHEKSPHPRSPVTRISQHRKKAIDQKVVKNCSVKQ